MDPKKIFAVVILMLIFVAVTPTILTSITGLNFTGFTVLDGMKDILAIIFVIGVGVFGVGKLVGLI